MLYLCLLLNLLTLTNLYPSDLEEKEPSLDEIAKQVATLACQTETHDQRLNKIEAQIEELHRYNKKLNKRIKKFHEIFHQKMLAQEKAIKELRGYNEALEITPRLRQDSCRFHLQVKTCIFSDGE
jgi:septal ring factor EnvC (AmiA/AmiB activator)